MVRSMPEGIPPRLIAQARENPSGELAWRYPTVLEVVAALAARGHAMLGGHVMHEVEGGTLDYYHDNV